MMGHLHRWLAPLHRHGLHAAVLAGLIIMPAVVVTGFLTDGGTGGPSKTPSAMLRGTLDPMDSRPTPLTPLKTPPSEPRRAL